MSSSTITVKKLALAAMFVAVAVVGSYFISFPLLGSKCSPTQHMVNVLCAVFLGPGWAWAWPSARASFATSSASARLWPSRAA